MPCVIEPENRVTKLQTILITGHFRDEPEESCEGLHCKLGYPPDALTPSEELSESNVFWFFAEESKVKLGTPEFVVTSYLTNGKTIELSQGEISAQG